MRKAEFYETVIERGSRDGKKDRLEVKKDKIVDTDL